MIIIKSFNHEKVFRDIASGFLFFDVVSGAKIKYYKLF
jgi:hypothetical protein